MQSCVLHSLWQGEKGENRRYCSHLTSGEVGFPGGRAELLAPLGREGTRGLLPEKVAGAGEASSGTLASSASEPSGSASGRFLDCRACSLALLSIPELSGWSGMPCLSEELS